MLDATATGSAAMCGQLPPGDKLAIPAWAPSGTVGAVQEVVPAAPGDRFDGEEGKQAGRVETPTATPTVTPRESVGSAPESSVPAAECTAAAAAALVAAVAAAEDVAEEGLSVAQSGHGAAAAFGEKVGRESAEEHSRGALDVDGAHRAADAEVLAARLQEQLEEMKVRMQDEKRRALGSPRQEISWHASRLYSILYTSVGNVCRFLAETLVVSVSA